MASHVPPSQNQKVAEFKLSHIELEAGILDAVYDNDVSRVQRYLSYMQNNLVGSRKSKKRKRYKSILKNCRLLAHHYKYKQVLECLNKMPGKGNRKLSQPKDTRKALNQLHILRAVRQNNTATVTKLLGQTTPSVRKDVLSKGLGLACYFGHKESMALLLNEGADIYHGNGDALGWLAREGMLDTLKTLVDEHGLDIKLQDNATLISAVIAVADGRSEHLKTVRYLLGLGADVHAEGNKALLTAIDSEQSDIVCLLLEKGADLDVAFISAQNGSVNNANRMGLIEKFQKWWPVYQGIYEQAFTQRFGDDYSLGELKDVVDKKTGLTGLGMAAKAGVIQGVLERFRTSDDTLGYGDIQGMGGKNASGLQMLANRGALSKVFSASLWRHSPSSMLKLWEDLSENEQKEIKLKDLFAKAKSMNLRHFVKHRHKHKGPSSLAN